MKKITALYASSLLVILCTFLILSNVSGIIFLLLISFTMFGIPVIHFNITASLLKKSEVSKKAAVFSTIIFLATVIAKNALLKFIFAESKTVYLCAVVDISYVLICGLLTVADGFAVKLDSKCKFNFFTAVEAVLALLLNTFGLYLLIPLVSSLSIDAVELIFIPIFAVLLSVVSYRVGYRMTQKYVILKLSLWFIGIFSSVFISLYISGLTDLPVYDMTSMLICIISSLVIFVFSLAGLYIKRQTD